jgi:hypothetical protein
MVAKVNSEHLTMFVYNSPSEDCIGYFWEYTLHLFLLKSLTQTIRVTWYLARISEVWQLCTFEESNDVLICTPFKLSELRLTRIVSGSPRTLWIHTLYTCFETTFTVDSVRVLKGIAIWNQCTYVQIPIVCGIPQHYKGAKWLMSQQFRYKT